MEEYEGLYLKQCTRCPNQFLTDKPHKQQCPECDKTQRRNYAECRKSWNKSPTTEVEEERVKKPVLLQANAVCAAAKAEGTTYGKYLYEHHLYAEIDTTIKQPTNKLTYRDVKVLAEAAGMSYRDYVKFFIEKEPL